MRNWKLLLISLLTKLAWACGESCIVENGIGKLNFKYCTIDDLKYDKVSMNPDNIKEMKATGANNFTKLDDEIFKNFRNLETLYLARCNISEISNDAFQGMVKLKNLDLSNNKLKNGLDESILMPLINLQKIYLGGNSIEHLDKNLLKHNPNLSYLSLSGNQISSLDPDFFPYLSNLEELWLNHNQITTLSRETFEENRNLQKLYLHNNKISAIERDTFRHLTNLIFLDLKGNECIDEIFEKHPEINMSDVTTNMNSCQKNFENLLKVCKKSLMTNSRTVETSQPPLTCPTPETNIQCNNESLMEFVDEKVAKACPPVVCPTPEVEVTTKSECNVKNDSQKFYTIIFGSISFFLFIISLLVNIIQCIRKPKNSTSTSPAQEEQPKMNQRVESPYTPMNAHSLGARNLKGRNDHSGQELVNYDDGRAHVYQNIMTKPSQTH
jgi:hypothetical protein